MVELPLQPLLLEQALEDHPVLAPMLPSLVQPPKPQAFLAPVSPPLLLFQVEAFQLRQPLQQPPIQALFSLLQQLQQQQFLLQVLIFQPQQQPLLPVLTFQLQPLVLVLTFQLRQQPLVRV